MPSYEYHCQACDRVFVMIMHVNDHDTAGVDVELPTLNGLTTVSIPPGTQPDTLLRLHGKGLPVFRSEKRGDAAAPLRQKTSKTHRLAPSIQHLGWRRR